MKEITHSFGVETDWVDHMVQQLDGEVVNGRFIVPREVYTGSHYVTSVSPHITVMLADMTYQQDVCYKLRNRNHDFVGIYFNLNEGESLHILGETARPMGRWKFNLAILDSALDVDYSVKAGTKTFNLSLFVRKSFLKEYLTRSHIFTDVLDHLFDDAYNTIVRYDRMDNHAWQVIHDLQRRDPNAISFDVFLQASVYFLLASCIDQGLNRDVLIQKVDNTDIKAILAAQSYLLEQLENPFPGISVLAKDANMSETKFKRLYLKVTGMSPSSFFYG